MSEPEGDLLLPVLGWGVAGGLLGSLSCCCWFGPVAGGWLAGRHAARVRPGGAGWVGPAVGGISALVVSSLGTALFLATSDAELMAEVGAGDLSQGSLAAAYAALGFGVSITGATLGALVGGRGQTSTAPTSTSALRFLDEPMSAVPSPRTPPAVLAPRPPIAAEPAGDSSPMVPSDPALSAPVADPTDRVPPNDKAPAEAGAVDVSGEDLASDSEERDAWD